jgi:integrase
MDASEYLPAIEDTSLKRSRKTGYWEIRYSIPASVTGTGRARSVTRSCHTKDHRLALKVRGEFLNAAGAALRALSMPTIEKLIELYEADHVDMKGVKPTQMESLKPIRKLLGALEPGVLSAAELSRYRSTRLNGGGGLRKVQPGTVRRELGALRAVLNWAQREGHLPHDFVQPHISLPPEGQARERYLSGPVEDAFHRYCENVWRSEPLGSAIGRAALFAMIALNTAARAEAIEALTWDRTTFVQIDFRDPTQRATKKRRVPVPVSKRLEPILMEEWKRQGDPLRGFVLRRSGSTRVGFDKLKAGFGLAVRDITRHDLRRTWATLAAQRGVSLFDIAGVLGDTHETVEKHYAHHHPDHLRAAINARA